MERANIERINALTAISRQRDLTAEEQVERQQLRAAYLKAFRSQMRQQLDNTVIEYPDGTRKPLRDVNQ
ncbi:MAG: DUF896 domain-containing protein [Candidatus Faecivicinus sp.]